MITAIGKVRRAFDVTTPAQEAALASLDDSAELARRRAENNASRPTVEDALRAQGLEPVGPAVGNFVFAEVGADARPLFEALLREGVIVRPAGGFGAPGAIRVSVGTAEENAIFADALGRVIYAATSRLSRSRGFAKRRRRLTIICAAYDPSFATEPRRAGSRLRPRAAARWRRPRSGSCAR